MKNKPRILLLSFFVLIIFIIGGCDNPLLSLSYLDDEFSGLTVSYIDVGQGDSTLIECGNEAMLIDAGIYSERYNVVNYLSQRGITELNYCVATHPHSDHIGGMSEIISTFDVNTLVYPLCDDEESTMNFVYDACDEWGVSYYNPEPNDTFRLGEATVTVLSPKAYADYNNLNNNSMVLKLEYGNTSFLFMGDAEAEVEEELLREGIDLSVDVLKCGHHGSSTSSTVEFINAVNPQAAVISCGKNNDYGHPHSETLSTLNRREIEIFRTDELSSVIANSDGETITFMSQSEILSIIDAKSKSEPNYIGNLNSKVFHLNGCDSIKDMNEGNKIKIYNRDDAILKGYTPCKSCNP